MADRRSTVGRVWLLRMQLPCQNPPERRQPGAFGNNICFIFIFALTTILLHSSSLYWLSYCVILLVCSPRTQTKAYRRPSVVAENATDLPKDSPPKAKPIRRAAATPKKKALKQMKEESSEDEGSVRISTLFILHFYSIHFYSVSTPFLLHVALFPSNLHHYSILLYFVLFSSTPHRVFEPVFCQQAHHFYSVSLHSVYFPLFSSTAQIHHKCFWVFCQQAHQQSAAA